MTAPPPPVPADADLRNFHWAHWPYKEQLNSLWWGSASNDARVAVMELVGVSLQQVPAGSLPNDMRFIAARASYGRDPDGWRTIADDVLRAFVLCSDGRWYHPLFAPYIAEAWRTKNRKSSFNASEAARKRAARKAKAANDQARLLRQYADLETERSTKKAPRVRRTSSGRPGGVRLIEREKESSPLPQTPKRTRTARAVEGEGAATAAPDMPDWMMAARVLVAREYPLLRTKWEACEAMGEAGVRAASATDARFLRIHQRELDELLGRALSILAPGDAPPTR